MKDQEIPNPQMFLLAREARGLTQAELSVVAGLSQAFISKVEAGLTVPDGDFVAKVADGLEFPLDFFFQGDRLIGPGTSEFFHRKRQVVPVRAIRKAHAEINVHILTVERLLRAAELVDCRIPQIDPDEHQSVEEIARAVRASWGLPPGPIADVIEAIEDVGGIVVRCKFAHPKIDAISRWVPGLPPMFFTNESIPADRERHTLAHELGHLVMHATPRPDMEREADAFAAEFLMPAAEIKPYLNPVNLQRLAALKPHWKVSMASLLHRAGHLSLVSEGRLRSLWVQMSHHGYRRREPAELDLPRSTPTTMAQLVEHHRSKLGYSNADLAQAVNWLPKFVDAAFGPDDATAGRSTMRLVRA